MNLLSQIGANTSRHTGEGRRRDAHSLGGHKDGLVPKRRHAHDLQPLSGHVLRERIPDVPVCICLDADRLCLCLGCKTRRVRTRPGFDAGALGRGLGGRNDGICFCVGLGLKGEEKLRSVNVWLRGVWSGGRARTLRAWALMRATARTPSSCLTLLLFSRSTFCGVVKVSPYLESFGLVKTYSSLNLGLQSTLGELVHCARNLAC